MFLCVRRRQGSPTPKPWPAWNQTAWGMGKCVCKAPFTQAVSHYARAQSSTRVSRRHFMWRVRAITHEAPFTQIELCTRALRSCKWSFACEHKHPLLPQVEFHTWAQSPSGHAWSSIRVSRGRLCSHLCACHSHTDPAPSAKMETLGTTGLRLSCSVAPSHMSNILRHTAVNTKIVVWSSWLIVVK